MGVSLAALLVSLTLGQAPVEASARTTSAEAFVSRGPAVGSDLHEGAFGHAELTVQEREGRRGRTRGDAATLRATVRLGVDEFTVRLDRPGIPPGMSGPLPFPLWGGVALEVPVLGRSGIGWRGGPASHAAIAVVGLGSVAHNGRLIAEGIWVTAFALRDGYHADDDTHRVLPQSRQGDAELLVWAQGLPEDRFPGGVLFLGFEDLELSVAGAMVSSIERVPTVELRDPDDQIDFVGRQAGGVVGTASGIRQEPSTQPSIEVASPVPGEAPRAGGVGGSSTGGVAPGPPPSFGSGLLGEPAGEEGAPSSPAEAGAGGEGLEVAAGGEAPDEGAGTRTSEVVDDANGGSDAAISAAEAADVGSEGPGAAGEIGAGGAGTFGIPPLTTATPPTPLPASPQPSSSAPASPLLTAPPLEQAAPSPLLGAPQPSNATSEPLSGPAAEGAAPPALEAAPASPLPSSIEPENAMPATPLLPGISPLNTEPIESAPPL
jgi:hypothetical protein